MLSTASSPPLPPHLRTPSSLTSSSSTPAMSGLSRAAEASSSPSPSGQPPAHRRPSASSPSPPHPLTSSTPSPLSSSQTSSSSFTSSSTSSTLSTDRYVREFLLKCLQIVLHARLLSPTSEDQLPVSKTFNLHTPEAGLTHGEWDERMRGREGEVISLDVWLSTAASSASPVLLERWRLHHDLAELFAASPLSSSGSARRVDPTIMFKRMLLQCRALYSYVRLLPAAQLTKHVAAHIEHDLSPPFTLHYSLLTAQSASLDSFRHPPASYSFTPIGTPRGQFNMDVLYLADLAFIALPSISRQLPGEGVLTGAVENYMNRSGSLTESPFALSRRSSMPSLPFQQSVFSQTARAAAVSMVPIPVAQPHSLPSSFGHRRPHSNSHTHVESYSPATNTPTFTHGTPPTPSYYPSSFTDTPPLSSLPPSPHLVGHAIPHSHSSPIAIVAQPAPSPTHSSLAQSPPIAIPARPMMPASAVLSSRSLSSHSPVTSAPLRSRAYTQQPHTPLRGDRVAFSPPSAYPPSARPGAPMTGLSLLSQSGGQYALPPPSPLSSPHPPQRDAELAMMMQWHRALPPSADGHAVVRHRRRR